MNRILIIGSSGSGKSTLARKLGDILSIDVIHLDALFWRPGWVKTPADEWKSTNQNIVSKSSWIIDGYYGRTIDIRLSAADTVIYLDFHRTICIWRLFKRLFHHLGNTRPDMAPGCKEKIDMELLKYVWTFPKRRSVILEELKRYDNSLEQVIVFRTQKQVKTFLRSMDSSFNH